MAHYGDQKLYFILHPFPLTMHRQAWDAAQVRTKENNTLSKMRGSVYWRVSPKCAIEQTAAIVSQQTTSANHLYAFFDFLWQNQPSFSQAAFYGKTQADLYSLFSTYAQKWGVDNTTFYSKMGSDPIFNIAYNGVEMGANRNVYGTPTFFINGLRSNFDETTTYAQWVQFIDSLLPSQ